MTGPRVAAALVGFLVTVAASAQLGRTPSSAEVVGSVIAIIDGDTIRARDRDGQDLGRIRLLGIDAPELAHGESPQQCWAARAKARLAQLAPVGATIRLRSDPTQADRDAYGRPLRYVLVDGRDIQEILLVEGQARPFWPEVSTASHFEIYPGVRDGVRQIATSAVDFETPAAEIETRPTCHIPICRLIAVAPISTARSRPALPR